MNPVILLRNSRHQHRATYDSEGNILLTNVEEPETHDATPSAKEQESAAPVRHNAPIPAWFEEKIDAGTASEEKHAQNALQALWSEARCKMFALTNSFMKEGVRQYRWSAADGIAIIRNMRRGMRNFFGASRRFLSQPVWILRPNRKPKKYNRATLFAIDVVRFGGTFALIFAVLFVTLNYQSFWNIFGEQVNPLEHAQKVQEQTVAIDTQLKEKLLRSPALATAGATDGDLLAFLPPVGPPENRIIIPKLGLNVPLITPPYQSLLEENWGQVEKDIQAALAMGVVHYPGTARPGQAGNFFVTGHSSYYPWALGKYKSVFARLSNLVPGDEYYVYYGGDQHRYIVRSKKEVSPSNVDVLDQPVNKRLATLMTCTPVGTTLHRLILTAEEVDPVTGEPLEVGEHQQREEKFSKPEMLPI